MKVGTITFHGSHNYGSVLQAYALQEYTKKLLDSYHVPCEYQILNYRSKLQKDLYSAPGFDSLVNILKTLMYIPYKNSWTYNTGNLNLLLRSICKRQRNSHR